jgi:hypothetical protein
MECVVVVGGKMKCTHGGEVDLSEGSGTLTIDGDVVVDGKEIGISFADACPNPGSSGGPCQLSAKAVTGVSTVLSVDNTSVLHEKASGLTSIAEWQISDPGQDILRVSS